MRRRRNMYITFDPAERYQQKLEELQEADERLREYIPILREHLRRVEYALQELEERPLNYELKDFLAGGSFIRSSTAEEVLAAGTLKAKLNTFVYIGLTKLAAERDLAMMTLAQVRTDDE